MNSTSQKTSSSSPSQSTERMVTCFNGWACVVVGSVHEFLDDVGGGAGEPCLVDIVVFLIVAEDEF